MENKKQAEAQSRSEQAKRVLLLGYKKCHGK